MHMGNYLGVWTIHSSVMAATTRDTFGIHHPTVVPTNYEPDDDRADDERDAA